MGGEERSPTQCKQDAIVLGLFAYFYKHGYKSFTIRPNPSLQSRREHLRKAFEVYTHFLQKYSRNGRNSHLFIFIKDESGRFPIVRKVINQAVEKGALRQGIPPEEKRYFFIEDVFERYLNENSLYTDTYVRAMIEKSAPKAEFAYRTGYGVSDVVEVLKTHPHNPAADLPIVPPS